MSHLSHRKKTYTARVQNFLAHPGFRGGNTNAAFAVIRSTLRMDYGHPLLKPPI
jgi:hypothetical protein